MLLTFPKRQPKGYGKNIKLIVEYSWGIQKVRTVEGKDSGSHWVVAFTDRPARNDTVNLTLKYVYSLTDTEKEKLRNTILPMYRRIVELYNRAATSVSSSSSGGSGTPFHENFRSYQAELESAGAIFSKYQTKDGKGALDAVLTLMGLAKTTNGHWTIHNTEPLKKIRDIRFNMDTLRDLTDNSRSTSVAQLALSKKADKSCVTPFQNALNSKTPSSSVWRTAFVACANVLKSSVPAASHQKYGESISKIEQAWLGQDVTAQHKSIIREYQTVITGILRDQKTLADRIEYKLMSFSWKKLRLETGNEAINRISSSIIEGIQSRVETFIQQQDGTAVLEKEVDKRWFDSSTGILYVTEINDFIIPIMISFCPFDGCLRKGRVMWNSEADFGNSFSIDLGFGTRVLDAFPDPRNEGVLGILVGGSWNPFYFARLSMGAYIFENKFTHRWNTVFYIGLTINLLHAAEILGVIGLGIPERKLLIPTQ